MGKKILMISGEASGDLHGSLLISELKRIDPSITVKGMGGPRMREQGLAGIDSTPLSVVGIVEVFKKLPLLFGAYSDLKKLLRSERFDCVVLIDYPDFNLRFARYAKKMRVPVVYYISPQVWAWRRGRIKKIASLVTKMLVIFPFEKELYEQAGLDTEYVGHPLAANAVCELTKKQAREKFALGDDVNVVTVLPGSRVDEIVRHLSVMLEGVGRLEKKLGKPVKVMLPVAHGIGEELISGPLRGTGLCIKIVEQKGMYTALRASDAAVVASGTATLETALIGTPMVIIYKMSSGSYIIGKRLIGVDAIGLPNIVAGRTVVPELIQDEATPDNIAAELVSFFTDDKCLESVLNGYKEISRKLSQDGSAAQRAAEAVYGVCDSRCVTRPEDGGDVEAAVES